MVNQIGITVTIELRLPRPVALPQETRWPASGLDVDWPTWPRLWFRPPRRGVLRHFFVASFLDRKGGNHSFLKQIGTWSRVSLKRVFGS